MSWRGRARLSSVGKTTPLSTELVLENPFLSLEILVDSLLAAVDPAGKGEQEKVQRRNRYRHEPGLYARKLYLASDDLVRIVSTLVLPS